MDYITTTGLRTQSSELVNALRRGCSVSLIHRSEIVAVIRPQRKSKPLTENDIKQLKRLAEDLNLPKTSYKQRERIYRKHLMEKYGKGIS